MVLRKAVIDRPFDDDYFLYDEDILLSWRLRLKGYEIAVATGSFFFHYIGESTRRMRERAVYLSERNRTMNLLICYDRKTLAKVFPLLLLATVAKFLSARDSLFAKAKAYGWLLTHLKVIRAKRRLIQAERSVPDELILGKITCRLSKGGGNLDRFMNRISLGYCSVLGLPVAELARPSGDL